MQKLIFLLCCLLVTSCDQREFLLVEANESLPAPGLFDSVSGFTAKRNIDTETRIGAFSSTQNFDSVALQYAKKYNLKFEHKENYNVIYFYETDKYNYGEIFAFTSEENIIKFYWGNDVAFDIREILN